LKFELAFSVMTGSAPHLAIQTLAAILTYGRAGGERGKLLSEFLNSLTRPRERHWRNI